MKLILIIAVQIFCISQNIAQTKTITVKLQSFSTGDGWYFTFTDVKTNKDYDFNSMQCLNQSTRKKWANAYFEISEKCENNKCDLIGKLYKVTIEYKLVNEVGWNGEVWKKLKKKEKLWVINSLIKK